MRGYSVDGGGKGGRVAWGQKFTKVLTTLRPWILNFFQKWNPVFVD